MTVIANVATGDMCRHFTHRVDAVMAIAASTEYLRVINRHCRGEYIGGMAVFTDV